MWEPQTKVCGFFITNCVLQNVVVYYGSYMKRKQITKKKKSSPDAFEDFVKSSLSSDSPKKESKPTKSVKKSVTSDIVEKEVPKKTMVSETIKKEKTKPDKKKKIKKQEHTDGKKSTYFKVGSRVHNPATDVLLDVYLNVDKDHVVDQFTAPGTRVLVAKYPDFYKIYLYETHTVGAPNFPMGGVTVYNVTYEMMQYFSYESVAIHPEGGSYRFKSMQESIDK